MDEEKVKRAFRHLTRRMRSNSDAIVILIEKTEKHRREISEIKKALDEKKKEEMLYQMIRVRF